MLLSLILRVCKSGIVRHNITCIQNVLKLHWHCWACLMTRCVHWEDLHGKRDMITNCLSTFQYHFPDGVHSVHRNCKQIRLTTRATFQVSPMRSFLPYGCALMLSPSAVSFRSVGSLLGCTTCSHRMPLCCPCCKSTSTQPTGCICRHHLSTVAGRCRNHCLNHCQVGLSASSLEGGDALVDTTGL